MALERWRPRAALTPFRELEREMDELFNRFFGELRWPRLTAERRGWAPAIDMVDRKDEIVVRTDLPGLEQKDIEVSLENNTLTVRGERKEEKEAKEEDYYACERWAGAFFRSVVLPPGLEADKARASFRNGVLEIRIPKTKEARGKRIDIKVE